MQKALIVTATIYMGLKILLTIKQINAIGMVANKVDRAIDDLIKEVRG